METLDEVTLARNARAIEVLERLGNNEDRNRGAQARQAMDAYVGQAVAAGQKFSAGMSQLFADIGIKGGQAFDAAEDFIEQAPAAVMNAVGPNGVVNDVLGSIGDTIGGFVNPQSALSSDSQIDPAVQAQIDAINQSDPLASGPAGGTPAPVAVPDQVSAGYGQAPITPGGATPLSATGSVPGAITAGSTQAVLDQFNQQYLAQGGQINQMQLAQIQNALAVDEFNRAQAASQLVAAPQVQFSQAQLLGNANLAAQGVQPSISASVGALQQLSPSANIASVQPAINASANQSRRVNQQEQAAQADSLRAIQEAQKLSALKRQAFIDNVVVPRLGQRRE